MPLPSAIGFGAWAIGGDWGSVDDANSLRALHAVADAGVERIAGLSEERVKPLVHQRW
jgi:hypothetical protein